MLCTVAYECVYVWISYMVRQFVLIRHNNIPVYFYLVAEACDATDSDTSDSEASEASDSIGSDDESSSTDGDHGDTEGDISDSDSESSDDSEDGSDSGTNVDSGQQVWTSPPPKHVPAYVSACIPYNVHGGG